MSARQEMRVRRLLAVAAGILAAGWMAGMMGAQDVPVGQHTAGAGVKLYRIAGALTDSVSGKPVAGATMEILTTQTFLLLQSVITDPDGRFSFDPLPAGKFSLQATRRGYHFQAFNEHDQQFSSAIVTGENQDTEHIPFRINPGGGIRGRVTDDAGEPVTDAQVVIKRWTENGGLGEHLQPIITNEVDDQGDFEAWNLLPGKYVLVAKATPWFAIHPSINTREPAAGADLREARAALDVVYPLTYYDGVTDERSAAQLSLASGETAEVNFSLHAIPAVHLTISTPQNVDRYTPPPRLQQTILGDADFLQPVAARNASPDSSTIEYAVAPGHYSAEGGTPPHVAEIDATGDLDFNLAAGTPTIEKTMKVRMIDGSALPTPLEVVLLSGEQLQHRVSVQVGQKSEAQFPSIPSGQWTAFVSSNNLALAVVGVQAGSALKSGSNINVAGNGSDLTLFVARGKTRVEGFATKDGKGEAGVMIVLVPNDPRENLDEFRRDQSDSDGSFLLPNIIPGDYTIVAIQDGWGLEWARPQVIRKYLTAGIPITVPDRAGPLIKLGVPVPIQPR